MNATLSRRSAFKSPNTHQIGYGTRNTAFNLPDRAADIFERFALGNKSEFIRDAIARKIESIDKFAGIAFRVALNSHARIAMFFFVVSIPALSFAEGNEFEARRPRRAGMCARVGAHPVRKPQVAA